MANDQQHLERANLAAERAHRMLELPATLDSYAWGLIASLIVEAANEIERAQADDPTIRLPLLDTVVEELRDVTAKFTSAAFLAATKPARRQQPGLFTPRR
jgi:hypothetical protein